MQVWCVPKKYQLYSGCCLRTKCRWHLFKFLFVYTIGTPRERFTQEWLAAAWYGACSLYPDKPLNRSTKSMRQTKTAYRQLRWFQLWFWESSVHLVRSSSRVNRVNALNFLVRQRKFPLHKSHAIGSRHRDPVQGSSQEYIGKASNWHGSRSWSTHASDGARTSITKEKCHSTRASERES